MKLIIYLTICASSVFFLGCSVTDKPKTLKYQENGYIKEKDHIDNFDSSTKKESNEIILNSSKANSLLICNPETTILNKSIILETEKEEGDLIVNNLINDEYLQKFGYMIFINGKYFNQLGAFQYDIKKFKTGTINKIEIYKTFFTSGMLMNKHIKYSDNEYYDFMDKEEFNNSYVSNSSEIELYHFKKENEFDFYYTKVLKNKKYKENKTYLIAEKILNKTFTMIDQKKYAVLIKNIITNKNKNIVKYELKFIDQKVFKGYDYYINNYEFNCNLIKYKKTLKNNLI